MTQLRIDDMFGGRPRAAPSAATPSPSTSTANSANPQRNASPPRAPEKLAKDSARRAANRALAEENGRLVKRGYAVGGARVDLPALVAKCKRQTRSYTENDTERVLAAQRAVPPSRTTALEVSAESSMAAAQRLASSGSSSGRICVLNFASARHVGGGYLTGAKAQEEDVCRVSALYGSLLCAPDFYAAHRARGAQNLRYSHRMVYSGDVPVFRDAQRASAASARSPASPSASTSAGSSAGSGPADAGGASGNALLAAPYLVDILTSPAPNATALRQNTPGAVAGLDAVLAERAGRILALALERGAHTLVLGAWGCGVFGNDLAVVLRVFRRWLEGDLKGRFGRVVWAMNDARGADRAAAAFPGATRV